MAAWIPSLALAAHLVPARKLEGREKRERLPTGVAPLDALIGGGWPKGALSELAGRRTTGRTALLLRSLAEALRRGEAAALIDVGGTLDPRAAARQGVVLPRLLWIRCTPGKALAAAELVLGAGGFGLVALDLGEAAPQPGVPTAAWLRLKRGAEQQRTAVLVSAGRRPQGALGACAVTLGPGRPRFAGRADEARQGREAREVGEPPLLVGLEASASAERGGAEEAESPRLTFGLEE